MRDPEDRIRQFERGLPESCIRALRLAWDYAASDPSGSLTKSRSVLEMLTTRMFVAEMGCEPRRPLLGDMLADNQFTRKLDRRIVSLMNSIRDMGNLGAHGEPVRERDAAWILDALCDVVEWHLDRYGSAGGPSERSSASREPARRPARPAVDRIRDNLDRSIETSGELIQSMIDGTPLILAARRIAEELQGLLGRATTSAELRQKLLRDYGAGLSASVCGWNAVARSVEEAKGALSKLAASYTGVLAVMAQPLEMLVAIANDSYSALIFQRLLTGEVLRMWCDEEGGKARSERDLTTALIVHLQSNAAMYFVARYEQAVHLLNGFMATLGSHLLDLDDASLDALARAPVPDGLDAATRTETMQVLLDVLSEHLQREAYVGLRQLASEIDVSVSKTAAARRLSG